MASQEEIANSTHPPLDLAEASRAHSATQSEYPAARLEFFDQLIEARLAILRTEEQRIALMKTSAYEKVTAAEESARKILHDAHAQATALRGKALEEVTVERTRRLGEIEQFASTAKALAAPAPPRPSGGEVLGDLGKVAFARILDTIDRAMELNPEIPRKVARVATAVLGSEPAPGAEAPPTADPGAPAAQPSGGCPPEALAWTMGELANASTSLEPEEMAALLERWGVSSVDDMTAAHGWELVQHCRKRLPRAS